MKKEIEDIYPESIINYNNEDVIYGFLNKFNVDRNEALVIFEETKKWLWLCNKEFSNKNRFNFLIDDSLLVIDEMWHNFILFTKDYHDFCQINFGHYMHHQPTTKSDNDNWNEDPKDSFKVYKKTLKMQYEYIYDYLGEGTLQTWYVYFAEKYTKEYMKEISR